MRDHALREGDGEMVVRKFGLVAPEKREKCCRRLVWRGLGWEMRWARRHWY